MSGSSTAHSFSSSLGDVSPRFVTWDAQEGELVVSGSFLHSHVQQGGPNFITAPEFYDQALQGRCIRIRDEVQVVHRQEGDRAYVEGAWQRVPEPGDPFEVSWTFEDLLGAEGGVTVDDTGQTFVLSGHLLVHGFLSDTQGSFLHFQDCRFHVRTGGTLFLGSILWLDSFPVSPRITSVRMSGPESAYGRDAYRSSDRCPVGGGGFLYASGAVFRLEADTRSDFDFFESSRVNLFNTTVVGTEEAYHHLNSSAMQLVNVSFLNATAAELQYTPLRMEKFYTFNMKIGLAFFPVGRTVQEPVQMRDVTMRNAELHLKRNHRCSMHVVDSIFPDDWTSSGSVPLRFDCSSRDQVTDPLGQPLAGALVQYFEPAQEFVRHNSRTLRWLGSGSLEFVHFLTGDSVYIHASPEVRGGTVLEGVRVTARDLVFDHDLPPTEEDRVWVRRVTSRTSDDKGRVAEVLLPSSFVAANSSHVEKRSVSTKTVSWGDKFVSYDVQPQNFAQDILVVGGPHSDPGDGDDDNKSEPAGAPPSNSWALYQTRPPHAQDDFSRGFQVGDYWRDLVHDRMYKAIAVTVGAAEWRETITATQALRQTRRPRATDDETRGFRVGDYWRNVLTQAVFRAHSVSEGGAVWRAVRRKDVTRQPRAPNANDDGTDGHEAGDLWRHTLTGHTYRAQSVAAGAAVWKRLKRKKDALRQDGPPTADDDEGAGFEVGDLWRDLAAKVLYRAVDVTLGAARWVQQLRQKQTTKERRRPTAEDDASKGFEVGDLWRHTLTGRTFRAQSVATGAAVWKRLNRKKDALRQDQPPTADDDAEAGFEVGDRWRDVAAQETYRAADVTPAAARWVKVTRQKAWHQSVRSPSEWDDREKEFRVGDYWRNRVTGQTFRAQSVAAGTAVWVRIIRPQEAWRQARAPHAQDDAQAGFSVGDVWRDRLQGHVYVARDVSAGAAVWQRVLRSREALFQTRPPNATDDATAGFTVGACWRNLATHTLYRATNTLPGQAQWAVVPRVRDPLRQDRAPSPHDDAHSAGFRPGDFWRDVAAQRTYRAVSVSPPGQAVWELVEHDHDKARTTLLQQALHQTRPPDAHDDATQGFRVGDFWRDVIHDRAYQAACVAPGHVEWTEVAMRARPSPLQQHRAPEAHDDLSRGHRVGDVWRNVLFEQAYRAVSVDPGAAVWERLPRTAGPQHSLSQCRPPHARDDADRGFVVGSYWRDLLTRRFYRAESVSPGAAVWCTVTLPPPQPRPEVGPPRTPALTQSGRGPTAQDDADSGFEVGSFWQDVVAGRVYQARAVLPGRAEWQEVTPLPGATPPPCPAWPNRLFQERSPGPDDDASQGHAAGDYWRDVVHHRVYQAVEVKTGAAHWVRVEPGDRLATLLQLVLKTRRPTAQDDETQNCRVGDVWRDLTTDLFFRATSVQAGKAVWEPLAQSRSSIFQTGEPTADDDETRGWRPGQMWQNVLDGSFFQATAVGAGQAVWLPIDIVPAGSRDHNDNDTCTPPRSVRQHTFAYSPTPQHDDTQGFRAGDVWQDTQHQTTFWAEQVSPAGSARWVQVGSSDGKDTPPPPSPPVRHALTERRTPEATDDQQSGFTAGSFWHDTSSGQVFQASVVATGQAQWHALDRCYLRDPSAQDDATHGYKPHDSWFSLDSLGVFRCRTAQPEQALWERATYALSRPPGDQDPKPEGAWWRDTAHHAWYQCGIQDDAPGPAWRLVGSGSSSGAPDSKAPDDPFETAPLALDPEFLPSPLFPTICSVHALLQHTSPNEQVRIRFEPNLTLRTFHDARQYMFNLFHHAHGGDLTHVSPKERVVLCRWFVVCRDDRQRFIDDSLDHLFEAWYETLS